jgi:hypothetical protein
MIDLGVLTENHRAQLIRGEFVPKISIGTGTPSASGGSSACLTAARLTWWS